MNKNVLKYQSGVYLRVVRKLLTKLSGNNIFMSLIDKKYQVFVSSTYEDLQMERQEVMHALLELDCIPSGMELFPAANEDQWTLIKGVIDDCDYYLVIIDIIKDCNHF